MEAFDRNDSAGMRLRQSVVARLVEVGQRIDHASQKAGRGQARVTVVAVTKSLSLGAIPFLSGLGLAHFAENRPQELARRAPLLPTASWHMIGHIQRNKAAQTLDFAALIQSVDSKRLLEELENQSAKRNIQTPILIQVNGSKEPQKGGFDPDQPGEIIEAISRLGHITVKGFMTMARDTPDPETSRPTFALVRELLASVRAAVDTTKHSMDQLSMGMSGDYEQAILEGATMVRLGSVLFSQENP